MTCPSLYLVGKTPAVKDRLASSVSSVATASTGAIRSEVGMQSKGDDLGDAVAADDCALHC